MRILFLPVHPGLAAWVHSHWFFDTPAGLPSSDRRLVVPHGRTKLILTVEGPLTLEDGPRRTVFPEGRVLLIGPWDRPVSIGSAAERTRTVGLEFTPAGAHRFFDLPLIEVQNQAVDLTEVWPGGRELTSGLEGWPEAFTVSGRLQKALVAWEQQKPRANLVVDFAVREFQRRAGLVGLDELAAKTGYTRRTLDNLFRRHVGLSPKTLASILRFQRIYRAWTQDGQPPGFASADLDLYFDQSHLIREFKRYTGTSPGRFAREGNRFGQLFYGNPGGSFSHLSNS